MIKKYLGLAFLCLTVAHGFSQEAGAPPDAPAGEALLGGGAAGEDESGEIPPESRPPEEDESLTTYYIRNINFDVTGRTRPFALIHTGDLKKGEIIRGEKNLETYIGEKTRILRNQRVLEEVEINTAVGERDETGFTPVDLLVTVRDTVNIIAIPWVEYDSNSGLEASIKFRHYNFLGTMSPLRIDLGYERSTDDENSFFADIDSDVPFSLLGYNWNLNFDNYFGYTYDEPFQYKNTTGLSMELPYRRTAFTFGFEQAFLVYEENDEKDRPVYGRYFDDVWYMSSELYGLWKIPTGITIPNFGVLTYTPKLAGKIKYRPGGDIGELRRGPATTLSHILGFGQIDWMGNFRRGLDVALENSNEFNYYKTAWNTTMTLTAQGHLPITPWFAVSGRFQYRQWFHDAHDSAGDVLRGIKNDSITTKYMFSLNMDFAFLVKRFFVSRILFSRRMRIFNFDMHMVPFIDMALADASETDDQASLKNFFMSGGLEVMLFPHHMRSIYLRISGGFNVIHYLKTKDIPRGNNREIFIGLGHHY